MSSVNSNVIRELEKEYLRTDLAPIRVGDIVKVHKKIKEGNRERIQVFEGTIIKISGGGINRSFTVRKISYNIGVEETFPIHWPKISKIEIVRHSKVRRARLNFLRNRIGSKATRLKQKFY